MRGASMSSDVIELSFRSEARTSLAFGQWIAAFVQRLREHGWIEGRTVAIEYRWAEGHSERFPEIAAELVVLSKIPSALGFASSF